MLKHAALAFALTLSSPAVAETRADDLHWLSGVWESCCEPWIEEHWSDPRGGMLTGYSRWGMYAMADGFEFFRVAKGDDGVLVLYAQPAGKAAVPFRLTEAAGTSATFDNPAHDYPQRIRYERVGDSLTATLSKLDGSEREVFTFRRVSAP